MRCTQAYILSRSYGGAGHLCVFPSLPGAQCLPCGRIHSQCPHKTCLQFGECKPSTSEAAVIYCQRTEEKPHQPSQQLPSSSPRQMVPSSRSSASHSAQSASVLASLIEFRIIPVSHLEISTSHFSSCAAQPKDSADIKYKTHPTGILVMYILSVAAKF